MVGGVPLAGPAPSGVGVFLPDTPDCDTYLSDISHVRGSNGDSRLYMSCCAGELFILGTSEICATVKRRQDFKIIKIILASDFDFVFG